MQVEILKDQVDYLYGTGNNSLEENSTLYQQIEVAYNNGLASRTEILDDAEKLNLNSQVIETFFDVIDDEDDDEDDDEILRISKEMW
jgi:hypothetical protein